VKKFLYTNSSRPTCLKTTLSRILKNPFKISCILGTKLTDTATRTSYRTTPECLRRKGRLIGPCRYQNNPSRGCFVVLSSQRMKNPWKKLDSKMVHENPFFSVREDKVIRPDGKEGTYRVIEKSPSVFIVPITKKREVYLIGQYRYTTSLYSLEVPAGGSDGQRPLTAAKRELQEETGLIARKWTKLGVIQCSNDSSNHLGHIFLAQDLCETESNKMQDDGIDRLKIVPFKTVLQMITNGEITDGLSIAPLLMADLWLRTSNRRPCRPPTHMSQNR